MLTSLSQRLNRALSRVFYGWWIVAAGSVLQGLSNGFLWYGFTVFFLPIERDFGVSRAAISLVAGAARLQGGIEGPIAGWFIDRFGPRLTIILGVSMAGIGFLILSQAHSFLVFFIIYLLISLGHSGGFFHPISTAINSWFIRHRAKGIAMLSSVGGIGGVLLVPLLSYLVLNFGWRTAAVASGAITLIIGLPLVLPFYRSPESRGLLPDGQPPPTNADGSTVVAVDFSAGEALKTLNYWLLTTSITLRIAVTTALVAHMIPILVWKGIDEAQAAYLVSLFAFGNIFTPLIWGWMGDRWSKTWLSGIGILPGLVGVLLLFSQGTLSLFLFVILMAVIMGTTPLNWALIGDFFGRKSYGTLRGVMSTAYGIATFASPIFAGRVYDITGSYNFALIIFSVTMVITVLLFISLRHPTPPRRSTISSYQPGL